MTGKESAHPRDSVVTKLRTFRQVHCLSHSQQLLHRCDGFIRDRGAERACLFESVSRVRIR
jgi:hypothetical protein